MYRNPYLLKSLPIIPACDQWVPAIGRVLLFLLLLMTTSSFQPATDQRKLFEERRKQLLQQIENNRQQLVKTQANKSQVLTHFQLLQQQIKTREQLLVALKESITLLDKNIQRTSEVVEQLVRDESILVKEYSTMARKAYLQLLNNSRLLFLFSSESFAQAFRRWQYLKQYDKFRRQQVKGIILTREELKAKIKELENRKSEKLSLLTEEEQQKMKLSSELGQKNQLLQSLKKNEVNLKREINRQKMAEAQLNLTIANLIREETKKAEALANKKNAVVLTEKGGKSATTKANAPALSGFAGLKGKLSWPVEGKVSRGFGKQAHPTVPGVFLTNNGIDIQTSGTANVQAVYEGEVAGKEYIPGNQFIVLIKHGSYYSVYANMSQVYVNKGDKIKTRQSIGQISPDGNTGNTMLHFEIWLKQQHQNPSLWLR